MPAASPRTATVGCRRSPRTRGGWPLAEAGRKHVHARIDGAELPVRQETWRYGSPYTLVLTKTEELFRREDAEREHALTDLAWLRSRAADTERRARSG
jgi:hypothetical protein